MVARKVEVMAVLDCRAKENGAVICVVIGSVILISDGEGDTFGEMWASRRAGGEGDGKRGGGASSRLTGGGEESVGRGIGWRLTPKGVF